MRRALCRHGRTCVAMVFALALMAIAGVASAQQQVCLNADDQFAKSPPLLYRLVVADSGFNTRSIVGIAFQGGAVRVVTGSGALIGAQFEVSLRATDIRTASSEPSNPRTSGTSRHPKGWGRSRT